MTRVLRLLPLLILAAVFSAILPVNYGVVLVAALVIEKFQWGDGVVILLTSLCLDHFGIFPLGISLLPLLVMSGVLHLLKSRIFVQALLSRLLWLGIGVAVYYLTWAVLMGLRGDASLYIGASKDTLVHVAVEGTLAALLSPPLHRYLKLRLMDLRRPRTIVVP